MNLREVSHVNMVARGFTLIELILVTTIVTLVGVFVLPVAFSVYSSQVLTETVDGMSGVLRRAQGFALAGRHGASFGVHFTDGAYTLFEGSSYETRVLAADETMPVPATISVQGPADILFASVTGVPNVAGTIEVANEQRMIPVTILSTGIIEW